MPPFQTSYSPIGQFPIHEVHPDEKTLRNPQVNQTPLEPYGTPTLLPSIYTHQNPALQHRHTTSAPPSQDLRVHDSIPLTRRTAVHSPYAPSIPWSSTTSAFPGRLGTSLPQGVKGDPISMSGAMRRSRFESFPGASQPQQITSSDQRSKRAQRRSSSPRPPLPQKSDWVMWVGNLPSKSTEEELSSFLNQMCDSASDIVSIFVLSNSGCAFVNFSSEQGLRHAVDVTNGKSLRPMDPNCPKMVAQVRTKEDEEKAGVRGQRGVGLHRQWVKQQNASHSNVTSSSNILAPQPTKAQSTTAGRVAMDSLFDEPNSYEQDQPGGPYLGQVRSPMTDRYSSSDSSFFSANFPQRYFILKSSSETDLDSSVSSGMWTTQEHNQEILDRAFRTSQEVYLFFSKNKSGAFYGYATMAGGILPVKHQQSKGDPSESRSPPPSKVFRDNRFIDSSHRFVSSPQPDREISDEPTTNRTREWRPWGSAQAEIGYERKKLSRGEGPPPFLSQDGRIPPLGSGDGDEASQTSQNIKEEEADDSPKRGRPARSHRDHEDPSGRMGTAPAHAGQRYQTISGDAPKPFLSLGNRKYSGFRDDHGNYTGPINEDEVEDNYRAGSAGLADHNGSVNWKSAPAEAGQNRQGISAGEPVKPFLSVGNQRVEPKRENTTPFEAGQNPQGPSGNDSEDESQTLIPFRIEWISTTRLPFSRTREIVNSWNKEREVKIARDGTEVDPIAGQRLLQEWDKMEQSVRSGIPSHLKGPRRRRRGGGRG